MCVGLPGVVVGQAHLAKQAERQVFEVLLRELWAIRTDINTRDMSDKSLNLAAVLHGLSDLRIEPVELPTPEKGQVLLQVQSVGICGSDDHYLRYGKIGSFVCRAPMVLGHEVCDTFRRRPNQAQC